MKPKILCCFALIAIMLSHMQDGYSQQAIYLGAKGGLGIPNLQDGTNEQNPLNAGFSSRLGVNIGVLAEFQITDWFSIQPEINFAEQGGKKDGLQAFVPPDDQLAMLPPGTKYLYANFKNEARLNYIQIPVLAKFNFKLSDKVKFFINIGPYLGYLVSAKQVTSGKSAVYLDAGGTQPISPDQQSFDNTEDVYSQLRKVNFGLDGGIGLSMDALHGKVFVQAGGNYGFINIQKYAADGKNHTGSATIELGYSYRIEP